MQNNFSYVIVRCYQSNGQPDSNAPATIQAAIAAGVSRVDVYMFPCFSCGDPSSQVQAAVSAISGLKYDMFWFDIEGPGVYWGSSTSANSQFFEGLVQEAQSMSQSIGVYTSASQWEPIMGSYTGGSSFPLWYAHYDGNPSFSDFQPFNGWTSPTMKQYNGNEVVCGIGVDEDYKPNSS